MIIDPGKNGLQPLAGKWYSYPQRDLGCVIDRTTQITPCILGHESEELSSTKTFKTREHSMNRRFLTRARGCAFLFLLGPAVVSRRRRRLSAGQRVGHVVRHGRPEAAGCLHGHGLRHERLVVGRRPLGQPPRPLSAPSAALGVGRLRLQKNRDSDYLAILSLFKVIGYISDT